MLSVVPVAQEELEFLVHRRQELLVVGRGVLELVLVLVLAVAGLLVRMGQGLLVLTVPLVIFGQVRVAVLPMVQQEQQRSSKGPVVVAMVDKRRTVLLVD